MKECGKKRWKKDGECHKTNGNKCKNKKTSIEWEWIKKDRVKL